MEDRVRFPRGQKIHQSVNSSDIVNSLLKTNDGRGRIPNYVIWCAGYVSAKFLEPEGSISSNRFYGQLLFTRY